MLSLVYSSDGSQTRQSTAVRGFQSHKIQDAETAEIIELRILEARRLLCTGEFYSLSSVTSTGNRKSYNSAAPRLKGPECF